MKKALLLGALAGLALVTVGCALTDYGNGNITPGFNKSHGVVDCITDDRVANMQQTGEISYRALVPIAGCTGGTDFNPTGGTTTISFNQAKAWGRFVGSHSDAQEASTSGFGGSFDGTWYEASVMDNPGGGVKISTQHTANPAAFGNFSCGITGLNGREGMVEGNMIWQGLGGIGPIGPETVAVDTAAPLGFCTNIAAATAGRFAGGYSTYSGLTGTLGRAFEGRLDLTPITRRAGLAEFFGGAELDITVDDITATISGELLGDGRIAVQVLALDRDGVRYDAENPITFNTDMGSFRTVAVDITGHEADARAMAQWLLDAGMTDRPLEFDGLLIPELGVILPEIQHFVVGATVRDWLNGQNLGGEDDGTGFGG